MKGLNAKHLLSSDLKLLVAFLHPSCSATQKIFGLFAFQLQKSTLIKHPKNKPEANHHNTPFNICIGKCSEAYARGPKGLNQ